MCSLHLGFGRKVFDFGQGQDLAAASGPSGAASGISFDREESSPW